MGCFKQGYKIYNIPIHVFHTVGNFDEMASVNKKFRRWKTNFNVRCMSMPTPIRSIETYIKINNTLSESET